MPINKDILNFYIQGNTFDRSRPLETFPGIPQSNSPINLGDSQYDTGLSLSDINNIDNIRYARQSWYNQLGNMLGRGVSKGIVSLGYTPALLGDMFSIHKTAEDFDNSLVKSLDEAMKSLDESLPEYSRYIEGSSDFKPWSWDFWMRNGDSVLESAIGFGVPGGLIGGGLTKAGKFLTMSNKLSKAFGATGSAYIMNHVEGMREATELYSNLLEQGLSEEEAAKAADEVVWNNKINLLFQIPQTYMLLKGFRHSRKNANIDKSWLKTRGKELGEQALSEGVEEVNTGFIVSESERNAMIANYNKQLSNPNLSSEDRKEIQSKLDNLNNNDSKLSRYFDYMLSEQGLTEFTLGAVGGIGFDVIGKNAANVFAKVKGQPTEEAYKSLAKELIGNNPEKVREIFNRSSKIYEDMIDASFKGDEEVFNINRDKLLAHNTFSNMELGTFEQWKDTIKSFFDNMTEEEAIANNLDFKELQEIKESTLSKLDKMESVYNNVENKYEGYSNEIKSKIFETQLSLSYLPDYIESINNKIDKIYSELKGYEPIQLDLNKTINLSKTINSLLNNKNVTGEYKTYLEQQKKIVDKLVSSKLDTYNSNLITDSEFADAAYYDGIPNKKNYSEKDFSIPAIESELTDLQNKQLELGFINEENKKAYKELTNPNKLNELQKQLDEQKQKEIEEAKKKSVDKAKSDFNNIISNIKDINQLKTAYNDFKNSKEFKDLSSPQRKEIDKQYREAVNALKTSKTTVKTETATNEPTNNVNTDNNISENDDIVVEEVTEKDVITHNDKLAHDLKKESIVSFAYLNVLYTEGSNGKLTDLFDEDGNLVFEAIRDWDLLDYDKLTINKELEIFIDKEYAKSNNIPINEENIYRIPFGIRFKGSTETAAYVHSFDNKVKDNEVDTNIERFIQESKQSEEQAKLLKLRNELFDALVKTSKSSVNAKISFIHPGKLAVNKTLKPSSEVLGDDVVFGVVDSKTSGFVKMFNPINTDKYSNSFSVSNYPNGAVVAMLPSYQKDEGKIVLRPALLMQNKLSPNDIETAYHIIDNYNKYNSRENLDKLGLTNIKDAEDLLSNIVLSGRNTNSFKIEYDSNTKKRYIYTSKNTNGSWNKNDRIDVSDKNDVINFLKDLRYNIKSTPYVKLKLDSSGNLEVLSKNIPVSDFIKENTQTNVNPFDILDNNGEFTGKKGYFVQPVIEFNLTEKQTESKAKPNTETKTEEPVKKTRKPLAVKKESEFAPTDIKVSNAKPSKSEGLDLQFWLEEAIKISNNKPATPVAKFPEELRNAFKQAVKDEYSWGLVGAAEFYKDYIPKLIAKQSNNTHNLEVDYTSTGNPAITAKINRIVNSDNKYEAVGNLILETTDNDLKDIMFKVFKSLNNNTPKIAFHFNSGKQVAQYDASINTISINKANVSRSSRELSSILAHEMIHAGTVNKLKIKANRDKFLPLYNEAKSKLGNKYPYAFKNIFEFVAEAFSNQSLKEDLKNIKSNNTNWFQKFINFIKELFGIKTDSIYDMVYKYTGELLESDNITDNNDTYDLYDNFMVPGLTVYQTEEMLKSIIYITVNKLTKKVNTSKEEMDNIIQNEITNAYNRTLEENKDNPILDAFDAIMGEEGDFNTETYRKLIERTDSYIKKLSHIIREDDSEFEDFDENDVVGKESYGKNAYEINPKDSASSRLKAFLGNLSDVYFKDESTITQKPNVFNMISVIPYDTVYNSLVDNLSNLPANKIFDELTNLAEFNPVYAYIKNKLMEMKESGNLDQVATYREFISNFSKQKAKFVTFQFTNFEAKKGFPVNDFKVLYTNNRDSVNMLTEKWYSNFRNKSNLLNYDNGDIKFNDSKVKEIIKKKNDILSNIRYSGKDKLDNLLKLLNELGIETSSTLPDYIVKNINSQITQITEKVVHIINRVVETKSEEDESGIERVLNNPFLQEEGNIKYLAQLELKLGNNLFSSMFRNEEGKNIYAIFNNTVVSRITQDMFNKDSIRYKEWKDSTFHNNSYVFKQLESGVLNKDNFDIYLHSTLNSKSSDAKSFKSLTSKERMLSKIIGYTNSGFTTSYFQFSTQSDKTSVPYVKMPRLNVSLIDGKLNNETLEIFYSMFLQEMTRIEKVRNFYNENKGKNDKVLIENYHVSKGKSGQGFNFFFLPSLNDSSVILEDSPIDENGNKIRTNIKDLLVSDINDDVRNQIIDIINNTVIETIINPTSNELLRNGFITPNGRLNPRYTDRKLGKSKYSASVINNFAVGYAVNYAIAYNSVYTLFNNDPAFAKNAVDVIKRGAMNLAPGVDSINEGTFKVNIIADEKIASNVLEELKETLPNYTDRETSNKILDALSKIDSTDAQAWCSIKHYREMLNGIGRLTKEMDNTLNSLEKGEEVSRDAINRLYNQFYEDEVLQPRKPVYVDDVFDPISKTYVRRYLKYSVFPLFKSLTENYPRLDAIRQKLEDKKNPLDLVIAVSGVKEGAQNITNIDDINSSDAIELPWTGWRLQQEVPYDKKKLKINTVSQARKLLFGDLLAFEGLKFNFNGKPYNARELKEQFDKLFITTINEEYDKLVKRLDLSEDENGNITIGNVKLISDLLADEAIRKNYDDNFITSLQVVDNKFVIPLWISTYADQIESLLTSVVTNRIVKQKMPGRSFVQGSPLGFNVKGSNDSAIKGLNIENGKLSDEGILLPNIFKAFIKEGDVISEDLLRVVGFRIPNQGHNSMVNLKIKGFLPVEVGDLVIVSPDMLVRMGSDFDVDKLYLYIKNAKRVLKGDTWHFKPYVYSTSDAYLGKRYNEKYTEYAIEALKNPKFNQEIKKIYDDLRKASSSSNINYLKASLSELEQQLNSATEEEQDDINENLLNLTLDIVRSRNLNSFAELIKDEAHKLGYPTMEEFMQLPIEEQNSKKARQNAIIDIYNEVLGKAEIAARIMRPNDLSLLENANKNVEDALGINKNISMNLLSTIDQDNMFESNVVGKSAVGETSLWSTFLAQAQYTNLRLNTGPRSKEDNTPRNLGVKFLDDDNKLISDASENSYPANKKIGLFTLNKVKGLVNNSFISDILQVLQSAAVDNAKEQQMGRGHLNDVTLKPAMYIAVSGIDSLDIIISFISQESVKDFVGAINAKRSILETPSSISIEDRAFNELSEYYINMVANLGGTVPFAMNVFNKRYVSLAYTGELPAFSKKELFELLEKGNKSNFNSLNDSEKLLYLQKQYEILHAFKYYYDISKQLGSVINNLNVDTKSIGKNFIELENKNERIISDIELNNLFLGIEELYSNTVAGTIFDKAISPANQMFKNQNIYPKFDFIKQVIDKIKINKNKDNISNQDLELIKRQSNHFLSNTINGLFTESISETRNRLINSDNNLVKRLYDFKQSTNDYWITNMLQIDRDNKIVYPNSKLEGNQNMYAIASLIEMLNSNDNVTKELAEDLIKYSFLTSGNNRSLGGLSNIIPIEYLLEKGFGDFYNSDNIQNLINSEEVANRFLDQFYRNNPTKTLRLPNEIIGKTVNGVVKIKKQDLDSIVPTTPKYFYKNEGKGEQTLFGIIGMEGNVVSYQALNLLNNEYSLLEDLTTSVYKENNLYDPFLVSEEITTTENTNSVVNNSDNVTNIEEDFEDNIELLIKEPMNYIMPAKENIWNKDTSTIDEIISGRRTSTTRGYWHNVVNGSLRTVNDLVGKILTFNSKNNKQVKVKILSVHKITKEDRSNKNFLNQWSQSEGWTIGHLLKETKVGEYQVKFTTNLNEKVNKDSNSQLNLFEDNNNPCPF